MNPVLVIVLGWLCLGLEKGLAPELPLRLWGTPAMPSFLIPLAVVIALCAAPMPALWSCLALGLALDLTTPSTTATGQLWVAGPYALGFLVAGQFVLLVRGLVIRRNPLTVLALSVLGAAIMQIVVTAIYTIRSKIFGGGDWHATAELSSRLISALLTGGSGFLLSLLLLPMSSGLGLHGGHSRQWGRR